MNPFTNGPMHFASHSIASRFVPHEFLLCLIVFVGTLSTNHCLSSSGFRHGVASGDPGRSEITLWTRLEAPADTTLVRWEIAKDDSFRSVVQSGQVDALRRNDFCVHVRVKGLQPSSQYYYRFRSGNDNSPIGRTRTLPVDCGRVRIAVVNCAKFEGGFYHAYRDLAERDDVDVVLHLGDYIYDNGTARPGSSYYPATLATHRRHQPPGDCKSLADYRTRYSQYRKDADLQALHARHPMVVIWDDHDIAKIPKQKRPNGLPDYESDWSDRFENSVRAWHEWIPTDVKKGERIYRSFQFGSLIKLLMLDTRVCCKSRVTKTQDSLQDPNRHIVGNQQLDWIFDEIQESSCTWNIIGNQLLFAEKDAGWNRWTGFPADRNRFLRFVSEHPSLNFIMTTGNAHNPHHYLVHDANRKLLFHEVLPGSVSSGNRAEKAHFDRRVIAESNRRLRDIRDLVWFKNNEHGYIVLDIQTRRAVVEWIFVSNIRKRDFTTRVGRRVTIPAKSKNH